ncbi:nickel pincer cofactor biosynthesis protein LarC [Rosistilla oblonga]|uniref:nickel pincer cofactor biosynthesis protein LarC n=1 Tax=Rosistilla oblonga TaxID=2527990 RepID=UPI003A983D07
MRIAYFDCTSGISGDMTLGALIDAGASIDRIQAGVRSMGLGEISITAENIKKYGFRATQVTIAHPPEHAHRHLHHIEAMLDKGDISAEARDLAKLIFRNLGEAEAQVHGSTLEKVHFHEVGAIDSIADITGVAIALTELGIERVEASPVPTGGGTIQIAHGRVGVPAPATALLLAGIPIAPSDIQAELTTPTGAAILKTTCKAFGPIPAMQISAIGCGSGTMDLEKQANILRVLIGDSDGQPDAGQAAGQFETDQIVITETNVDDSTAEELAWCVDQLFDAGALDVYQTPTMMKKGRSGTKITVLAAPDRTATIESVLLGCSSAIGVRSWAARRTKLIRRAHAVETSFGSVQGKCVWLPSSQWRFTPEHESLRQLAAEKQVSLHAVRDAAVKAFDASDLSAP